MTLSRRRFLGSSVAAATGLVAPALIACGDDDDDTGSNPTTAAGETPSGSASATGTAPSGTGGPATGSITLAVDSLADESLDMARFSAGQQLNIMLLANDTLVRRNAEGRFIPALATSWESTESGWEFKLNPEAKFHDGSPITADDVAFMVERMLMPENKNFLAGDIRALLTTVEAVDQQTVRFNTSSPFALMLTVAWGIAPQPRAYFEAQGTDGAVANYIGSGPFKLTSHSAGQSLTFEAVDDFYDAARRPRIKEVTYRIIPDAGTRYSALETGEVQVAQLTPVTAKRISEGGDLRVIESVATGGQHLVVHDLESANGNPLMKDLRVRKALLMALDRDAIVQTVLSGRGMTMATPFFPNLVGYDSNLEPYPFDPTEAKAMLTAAGAEGMEFNLNSFGAGTAPADDFPAMAAYWEQVGLKVKINQIETLSYLDQLKNRTLTGIGHMSYSSAVAGIDGVKLWSSYAACGQQYSNACMPDLDAVRDRAATELVEEQRAAALSELNKTGFYDQLPVLPKFFTSALVGVSSDVKHLQFPTGWVYFGGFPLETAEVQS